MLIVASKATRNWAEDFVHLLDAYRRLGEQLLQVDAFENLFGGDNRMQKLLESISIDILDFHRLALIFFRKQSKVTTNGPAPLLLLLSFTYVETVFFSVVI